MSSNTSQNGRHNKRAFRSKRRAHPNGTISRVEVKGHKLTPPPNPPDVTIIPWFNYVIVDTFKSKKDYDVTIVADLLKARMDPTKRLFNWKGTGDAIWRVQLKVKTILCWNLTGKFITLSVDDYSDAQKDSGARDQLCGLIDAGTQLHTPACGYRLPLSTQNCVLRNDDKTKDLNICHVNGGNQDVLLVHIHILFRADGPVGTFETEIATLAETNEYINGASGELENLRIIAQSLHELAIDSKKSRPSTVKTVWNGLLQAAQVVAVAAADNAEPYIESADSETGSSFADVL